MFRNTISGIRALLVKLKKAVPHVRLKQLRCEGLPFSIQMTLLISVPLHNGLQNRPDYFRPLRKAADGNAQIGEYSRPHQ